jgi:hypothetical protein
MDSDSFNTGVGVTVYGIAGNIVSWFVVDNVGRRRIPIWAFVYSMATGAMAFMRNMIVDLHFIQDGILHVHILQNALEYGLKR